MANFFDEHQKELEEQQKDESDHFAPKLYEQASIPGPWHFTVPIVNGANLSDLLSLVNSCKFNKGSAEGVIDNIYLYNSTVNIIRNKEGQILLLLPKAEVAIDLFHSTKEEFIGPVKYDSADHYVKEILDIIGCRGYTFLALDEALNMISLLRRLNDASKITRNKLSGRLEEHPVAHKGAILSEGTSFLENSSWIQTLNSLFHGRHNWACTSSYVYKFGKFDHSLLPYEVFCYECLPYIRIDGDYCIETKAPLDNTHDLSPFDESTRIAIVSCYSPENPEAGGWRGQTGLRFFGIYKLDKRRSKEENHLAFKLYEKELYL